MPIPKILAMEQQKGKHHKNWVRAAIKVHNIQVSHNLHNTTDHNDDDDDITCDDNDDDDDDDVDEVDDVDDDVHLRGAL